LRCAFDGDARHVRAGQARGVLADPGGELDRFRRGLLTLACRCYGPVYGQRPFKTHTADRAANFWPLAVISFGESWHYSHHADPTCARHGSHPASSTRPRG
jgi:hypothetical protein